jgi:predicted dithiol-disulfide oxidoreductase (DUF899 family)
MTPDPAIGRTPRLVRRACPLHAGNRRLARHERIYPRRDNVFRTYFIAGRGDEVFVNTWNFLDMTALGRQEEWEDSPEGYPQSPPYEWWEWHDEYGTQTPSR